MTKEEFRAEFGAQWSALVTSPMWQAALALAEEETQVFAINSLTDEEIEKFGHLRLKGMQGHTRLESVLVSLAKKPFEFTNLPEDYPDPVVEANLLENPPTKKPRKKKSP